MVEQPLAEGRDAANATQSQTSRFLYAAGLRWHVLQMGVGPVALLIHGTGAAVHSWRGLMPMLAAKFTVIAMDLPGHALTSTPAPSQLSLPAMAQAVGTLVVALGVNVELLVGHSAGAAIGARMVLAGAVEPRALVAINGAFMPLPGLSGLVFPHVARLMAATPFVPKLFAHRRWDTRAVERLIAGTGSAIDPEGLALYGALVRDPRHAAGALGMMSRWDVRPLARDMARLRTPLALIVGTNDRAVPPSDAQRVRALLPATTRSTLDLVNGAGHLVHEEQPATVAVLTMRAFEEGVTA